jgi:hypothetical protein
VHLLFDRNAGMALTDINARGLNDGPL